MEHPAYRRFDPTTTAVPLVFDSPHSGTEYPADFATVAPMAQLRTAEDTHVDALFDAAPAHGAALLAARFPRSYIDPNRSLEDIDPDLLDAPWPGTVAPGTKTRLGIGLVRRLCLPGVPMYARKLSVAEVQARIERCYRPYHAALSEIADGLHARFGAVWHVDCHSMKSTGSAMTEDGAKARPDFVIGDRDGTTCAPAFTALVVRALHERGWHVTVNDPYKGVELVRRHGRPSERRHSLQIEINRRLYMDEASCAPNAGFARTKAQMTELVALLARWASDQAA
jgi:N-formylglutamate deformylase